MVTMEIPAELQAQYLKRREKELSDCQVAMEQKNSDLLFRVGHQLKGNSLMFGYPELAEIGALIEESASKKDWDRQKLNIDRLGSYLRSLPNYPGK